MAKIGIVKRREGSRRVCGVKGTIVRVRGTEPGCGRGTGTKVVPWWKFALVDPLTVERHHRLVESTRCCCVGTSWVKLTSVCWQETESNIMVSKSGGEMSDVCGNWEPFVPPSESNASRRGDMMNGELLLRP